MGFLSSFRAESFFFVFSLQSGVVMSILVLAALTITSFVNIVYVVIVTGSFLTFIVPFLLSFFYMILLALGITIAFFGAYNENTKWMVTASVFTALATLLYIVLVLLSFLPSMYDTVCISSRCPDHQWIIKSYWRKNDAYSNEGKKINSSLSDPTILEQKPRVGNKETPSSGNAIEPTVFQPTLMPLVPRILDSNAMEQSLEARTTDWSFDDHATDSRVRIERDGENYSPAKLTTKQRKKYKLRVVHHDTEKDNKKGPTSTEEDFYDDEDNLTTKEDQIVTTEDDLQHHTVTTEDNLQHHTVSTEDKLQHHTVTTEDKPRFRAMTGADNLRFRAVTEDDIHRFRAVTEDDNLRFRAVTEEDKILSTDSDYYYDPDLTSIEPRAEDEDKYTRDDDKEKDGEGSHFGRELFSLLLSIIFSLLYSAFLCYVVYGFLSFANELQRELYGYY